MQKIVFFWAFKHLDGLAHSAIDKEAQLSLRTDKN